MCAIGIQWKETWDATKPPNNAQNSPHLARLHAALDMLLTLSDSVDSFVKWDNGRIHFQQMLQIGHPKAIPGPFSSATCAGLALAP